MTLIIPGVEVTVVKEDLAPQLAPSGVLGLVGIVENAAEGVVRGLEPGGEQGDKVVAIRGGRRV